MEKTKKLISIIIPCLNEEENVQGMYDEICRVWERCVSDYSFEILFIDDCSTDSTFRILEKLSQKDRRVITIRLSKTFGHQKAIFCGMLHARGESAIQLDCDLQDPPSLIPDFIKEWENGNHVVYGIRKRREESFLMQISRKAGYRIVNFLSESNLPVNAGDFRLVDRKIIDCLRVLDDDQSYLRGTIASMGFRQKGIEYDREARHRGTSKYSVWKLCKLALNGVINHSVIPLRLATILGIMVSSVSVMLLIVYAVLWYLGIGNWPRGFATITLLILFSIGLNGIFLGIIGEYIARIYRVLKKNSLIHVQEKIN
ncbi:glycosyl transferase, group 2 [Chitinispirillum alkaliphilum]|nr:glycosyl transferase, group 2 [Chitinispirillum alkaliphilum]